VKSGASKLEMQVPFGCRLLASFRGCLQDLVPGGGHVITWARTGEQYGVVSDWASSPAGSAA